MVEVLISILIISLILTGAYVTSNDSLLNIRASEERIQALGYAQAQIEDLRAEATSQIGTAAAAIQNGPAPFCFDTTNTFKTGSCSYLKYTATIVGTGKVDTVAADHVDTYGYKINIQWNSFSPNAKTGLGQISIFYRVSI